MPLYLLSTFHTQCTEAPDLFWAHTVVMPPWRVCKEVFKWWHFEVHKGAKVVTSTVNIVIKCDYILKCWYCSVGTFQWQIRHVKTHTHAQWNTLPYVCASFQIEEISPTALPWDKNDLTEEFFDCLFILLLLLVFLFFGVFCLDLCAWFLDLSSVSWQCTHLATRSTSAESKLPFKRSDFKLFIASPDWGKLYTSTSNIQLGIQNNHI